MVSRGKLGFAEYIKILQNSAFQPKPKAVAEIFSAEKQPSTYLGKVKKNHQGNYFMVAIRKRVCICNRVKTLTNLYIMV